MGFLKEKYTASYYLRRDVNGTPTPYGVEGINEFMMGTIREQDLAILQRLHFPGCSVLEFGYGRGEALKYALENGASKVIGVDFSENAQQIATDFLQEYNLKADLFCCDALHFLKEKISDMKVIAVDIVLMFDFVEHVPRSELSEIFRELRHWISCKCVIAVNTPFYKVDNDVLTEGLNPKALDPSDAFEETAGMHCNRYTKRTLRNFMLLHGFSPLSGQLFTTFSIPPLLSNTVAGRKRARNAGCPLKETAISFSEKYEYAMTRQEKARKMKIQNLFRGILRGALHPTSLLKRLVQSGFGLIGFHISKKKSMAKRCEAVATQPEWQNIFSGPLQGNQMLLDLNAHASWQKEMGLGRYDSFVYDLIRKAGGVEGKVVWDIGAHIGYHSLALASLVGRSGQVFAFEPNIHNLARFEENLQKNTSLAQRITLMKMALGDKEGSRSFRISEQIDNGRSSGSHLEGVYLPESDGAYDGFMKVSVCVSTIDSLIGRKACKSPEFVKIDVEGGEVGVLLGAQEFLKASRPLLIIEVHHVVAMHELVTLLQSLGYSTKVIDAGPISPSRCFVVSEAVRPDFQAR